MKQSIAHQRVLNYAYVDTDTLYQDFQIPQQGYNEKQVEESRIAYGRNVLSGRASDTVLYRLRRAFVNPFTVILFVLAAVSFLTDVVLASNFSRNITTSVIILCMLLLSGIVRFIQELRAERIADHLTRMVSSTVQVLRNGRWSEISSEELVVGDKVRSVCRRPDSGGHPADTVEGFVCFPVGADGRECDTGEECRYACGSDRPGPIRIITTLPLWDRLSPAVPERALCLPLARIRSMADFHQWNPI